MPRTPGHVILVCGNDKNSSIIYIVNRFRVIIYRLPPAFDKTSPCWQKLAYLYHINYCIHLKHQINLSVWNCVIDNFEVTIWKQIMPVSSLWHRGVIWRRVTWSTSIRMMACRRFCANPLSFVKIGDNIKADLLEQNYSENKMKILFIFTKMHLKMSLAK